MVLLSITIIQLTPIEDFLTLLQPMVRFNRTNIILAWDDINISNNPLKGTLILSVDPSHSKLVRISEKGGFGPSEWTRKC